MGPRPGLWHGVIRTIRTVTRGEPVFDIIESGPAGGEPVLLLHGFPQHASSWRAVTPLLAEREYRTLAMNQRGYSPGASPRGRRAYRIPELVSDAVAAIDQLAGGGPVHLVGHDARRDAAEFAGPSSFTGPLNWYRAMPLIDPRPAFAPVRRPALFVWSDRDDFVTRTAAERCGRYVQAPYRFETLPGVSHWIPDAAPAELVALLLPHLAECRGAPGGS